MTCTKYAVRETFKLSDLINSCYFIAQSAAKVISGRTVSRSRRIRDVRFKLCYLIGEIKQVANCCVTTLNCAAILSHNRKTRSSIEACVIIVNNTKLIPNNVYGMETH